MASGVEYFLKKTLGDDFFESLSKVELWKPGTKSTIDHEEIKTALQIVPRTIMSLLIRELAPLKLGSNHRIQLPVPGGAILSVTKHERDVLSGDITQAGKVIVDFKFRSIPGIGLIVMSAFELYDMESLINSSHHQAQELPPEDVSNKVQAMIDERLALHDLIERVVDKRIMEKDAIQQLILAKISEKMNEDNSPPKAIKKENDEERQWGMDVSEVIQEKSEGSPHKDPVQKTEKKKRPLTEFLENNKKKHEYSVVMTKGESVDCPDCGGNIFDGKIFSGCICLGDDMERKVFIKKESEGVKIRFSKGWDEENIQMLLEVLRKKKHE